MEVNNKTDEELWKLFLDGNKHALQIIYLRHYDLLFNYSVKFGIDQETVKDCIHDLFVKLYLKKNPGSIENVKAYLIKSQYNLLLNKRTQTHSFTSIEDSFNIEIEDSRLQQLFDRNDEDADNISRLMRSISQLSSQQKMVLYLRYIKDLSYKEIAQIVHITEQGAMNSVSRAKLKIRKLMDLKLFFFLFS